MNEPHLPMLMVVFGAGASYDSAPSHRPGPRGQLPEEQNRPPLAKELFEERFGEVLARFPRCQPAVPDLRHLQPGKSVEGWLEELVAEGAAYPESQVERQAQLAAIRCYIQVMIAEVEQRWHQRTLGVTNYKTLLDRIQLYRRPGESVCFVTFNYDTMLEEALPRIGISIASMDDCVKSDTYKVVKLHGSVSWGREIEVPGGNLMAVPEANIVDEIISRAATLTVSDRYRMPHVRPVLRLGPEQALWPAIAVPVKNKPEFECPREHIEALTHWLPLVRKLLVIGWSATDAPFLKLLRTHGGQAIRALVVAGDEGKEVAQRLSAALDRPAEVRPTQGGFTDLILQHQADAFLKEAWAP